MIEADAPKCASARHRNIATHDMTDNFDASGCVPVSPRNCLEPGPENGAAPPAGIEAISRDAVKGSDAVWRVQHLQIPRVGQWAVRLGILANDSERVILSGEIDIGRQ